jgi:hypothetical protein
VIWPEVVSVHPRPDLFGEVQPTARWLVKAIYGQSGTMGSPTAKRVSGFNPIRGSNPRTSAMTRGNAPPEGFSGGVFPGLQEICLNSCLNSCLNRSGRHPERARTAASPHGQGTRGLRILRTGLQGKRVPRPACMSWQGKTIERPVEHNLAESALRDGSPPTPPERTSAWWADGPRWDTQRASARRGVTHPHHGGRLRPQLDMEPVETNARSCLFCGCRP